MSCIVFAASYRTAIDLFYDSTNHTVNYYMYVDENVNVNRKVFNVAKIA